MSSNQRAKSDLNGNWNRQTESESASQSDSESESESQSESDSEAQPDDGAKFTLAAHAKHKIEYVSKTWRNESPNGSQEGNFMLDKPRQCKQAR